MSRRQKYYFDSLSLLSTFQLHTTNERKHTFSAHTSNNIFHHLQQHTVLSRFSSTCLIFSSPFSYSPITNNNSPFSSKNNLLVWTALSSYGYLLTFDVFKRLLMISLKFIFRLLDPLLTKERIQKYLIEI